MGEKREFSIHWVTLQVPVVMRWGPRCSQCVGIQAQRGSLPPPAIPYDLLGCTCGEWEMVEEPGFKPTPSDKGWGCLHGHSECPIVSWCFRVKLYAVLWLCCAQWLEDVYILLSTFVLDTIFIFKWVFFCYFCFWASPLFFFLAL